MRKPINDFLLVKDKIQEIGQTRTIEEVFKDLSESLAIVENDILTDNISENFIEDLGGLIINYLTLLSVKYNVDDLYDFLNSRSHWGIYKDEYFNNTREALVTPYYRARMETSSLVIKTNGGMSVKPLFDLAAYLIYIEEKN